MQELFFAFFWSKVNYTKEFISKWRKGELRVIRYPNIKVAVLNDYDNRRVLVWYFYEPTRRMMRVAYHGFYARYLANRIAYTVKLINTDDKYREFGLFERRSFSYKAEARAKLGKRG